MTEYYVVRTERGQAIMIIPSDAVSVCLRPGGDVTELRFVAVPDNVITVLSTAGGVFEIKSTLSDALARSTALVNEKDL
jgi:hypothetical protein